MSRSSVPGGDIPAPYLGPIFERNVEPIIASGYEYHATEVALHGVASHRAIDLDVPRGTLVIAPADGYYMATYGEFAQTNDDGQPYMLGREQAQGALPAGQEIKSPNGKGPWQVWFGSFVIQAWHTNGRYTQYAHVDWVSPQIPYHPPTVVIEHKKPTGDLIFSSLLRAPVAEYKNPKVAAFVRAGTPIARTGMTGCGWGERCFDSATLDGDQRPDFTKANYTHYTEPHLHLVVFGRRVPRSRRPSAIFDPFGIYGERDAGYPVSCAEWHIRPANARHDPLWLPLS